MLSFVIPTFKEGKALERTLTSIRTLTAYPFELIVSDGGSQDETLPTARQLASKVVEWHEPRRQTIGLARNLGAKEATGEYLVFMDADVVIPQMDTFFKKAFSNFEHDKNLALLLVQFRIYPEDERWADWFFFGISNVAMALQNNILHRGAAQGDFMLVRRDAFVKVGGFDESLVATEDMDLAIRLVKAGYRTRLDLALKIGMSARRLRAMGWPRLLWLWNSNYVAYLWRGKVKSEEWIAIR